MMRMLRHLAAAVTALVLAVPLLVTLPTAPAVAEPTTPTWITVSAYPRPADYLDELTIEGEVFYNDPDLGEWWLEGVTVTLQRRYLGTTTWVKVASKVTGLLGFEFHPTAWKNAEYRVTFAGDATYLPSSASVTVRVHRLVGSSGTEPRDNVFYLSGKVRPTYVGKVVYLMRKKCGSCVWRTIASQRTNELSRYRFRLPVPPSGATHYFRVRVPESTSFLVSYSDVWSIWVL